MGTIQQGLPSGIERVTVGSDYIGIVYKPSGIAQEGCLIPYHGGFIDVGEGLFVNGRKVMAVCDKCQKLVRLNKPLFGSFHFCS